MELSVAIRLIEKGVTKDAAQSWADLGAGEGLFSAALASLLKAGSTVYAIDKDGEPIYLKGLSESVTIAELRGDFVKDQIIPLRLDGILMANSLHYVADQRSFLNELMRSLSQAGRLIVVEYDMKRANQWVPFPINFESLYKLAQESGFTSARKMEEAPSAFNRANLYSALLTR